MGMEKPFLVEEANFCKIVKQKGLFIGDFLHSTETVSATVSSANHSYSYNLYQKKNNIICILIIVLLFLLQVIIL